LKNTSACGHLLADVREGFHYFGNKKGRPENWDGRPLLFLDNLKFFFIPF
jgi:hypothetical protein